MLGVAGVKDAMLLSGWSKSIMLGCCVWEYSILGCLVARIQYARLLSGWVQYARLLNCLSTVC
jgi:hypothetical protein